LIAACVGGYRDRGRRPGFSAATLLKAALR